MDLSSFEKQKEKLECKTTEKDKETSRLKTELKQLSSEQNPLQRFSSIGGTTQVNGRASEISAANSKRSEQRLRDVQTKLHEILDVNSSIDSEFVHLTLIDKVSNMKNEKERLAKINKVLNAEIVSLREKLRGKVTITPTKKALVDSAKNDPVKLRAQIDKLKLEITEQKAKYEKYLEETTLLATRQIKEMQKRLMQVDDDSISILYSADVAVKTQMEHDLSDKKLRTSRGSGLSSSKNALSGRKTPKMRTFSGLKEKSFSRVSSSKKKQLELELSSMSDDGSAYKQGPVSQLKSGLGMDVIQDSIDREEGLIRWMDRQFQAMSDWISNHNEAFIKNAQSLSPMIDRLLLKNENLEKSLMETTKKLSITSELLIQYQEVLKAAAFLSRNEKETWQRKSSSFQNQSGFLNSELDSQCSLILSQKVAKNKGLYILKQKPEKLEKPKDKETPLTDSSNLEIELRMAQREREKLLEIISLLEQDAVEAEQEIERLDLKLKKKKCKLVVLQGQIKSLQGVIEDQKNQVKKMQNELVNKKKLMDIFEEDNQRLGNKIEAVIYERDKEHGGSFPEKRKKELVVDHSVNTLRMKNHQLIYEKEALDIEVAELNERLENAMNEIKTREEEMEKLQGFCVVEKKGTGLEKRRERRAGIKEMIENLNKRRNGVSCEKSQSVIGQKRRMGEEKSGEELGKKRNPKRKSQSQLPEIIEVDSLKKGKKTKEEAAKAAKSRMAEREISQCKSSQAILDFCGVDQSFDQPKLSRNPSNSSNVDKGKFSAKKGHQIDMMTPKVGIIDEDKENIGANHTPASKVTEQRGHSSKLRMFGSVKGDLNEKERKGIERNGYTPLLIREFSFD